MPYTSGTMDWKHWYGPGLDHVWLPYAQMKTAPPPLAAVATEGCRIRLADGRELIDGIASWWTTCHGYNHPHIRAAVERQLAAMPHVMFAGLVHEPALTLAQRLARMLPGDLSRVFFSESGSVAVEIAMKMALQAAINRGEHQRTKFIAFKGGYHGDTTGAMSVTDPDSMHQQLRELLPDQMIVELPVSAAGMAELLALEQEHGDRLSVSLNGHREVFHRPHDGRVSIEDIELARHLLAAKPEDQGEGDLAVVTVDAKGARILSYDLDEVKVTDAAEQVRDKQSVARHLRTVERATGRDDEKELDAFFKELSGSIKLDLKDRSFVLLGHGKGKADVAEQFSKWLSEHDKSVYDRILGVAAIDLSAATDADIEQRALEVTRGGVV